MYSYLYLDNAFNSILMFRINKTFLKRLKYFKIFSLYTCIHIFVYVFICIYIYIFMYMHIYIYIYIWVCVYIYIHI